MAKDKVADSFENVKNLVNSSPVPEKVNVVGIDIDPAELSCGFCDNSLATSQDLDENKKPLPPVPNCNKITFKGKDAVLCNDCNKRFKDLGEAFGPKFAVVKQGNKIHSVPV